MTQSRSLSQQVADLESENAELREAQRILAGATETDAKTISDLKSSLRKAKNEAAELRAGHGRWPTSYAGEDHQDAEIKSGQRPHISWEQIKDQIAVLAESTATPRIASDAPLPVTAEMIRASEPGSTWDWRSSTWEWDGSHMQIHSFDGSIWGDCNLDDFFAPGKPILTRSTAAPRGDYSAPVKDADTSDATLKEDGENFTPPLTVHTLNTAPVGSVVTGWGVGYTKHYDGQWCDNTGRLWSDGEVAGRKMVTTLTYPKRGDRE